jgi:hypothetical protein
MAFQSTEFEDFGQQVDFALSAVEERPVTVAGTIQISGHFVVSKLQRGEEVRDFRYDPAGYIYWINAQNINCRQSISELEYDVIQGNNTPL